MERITLDDFVSGIEDNIKSKRDFKSHVGTLEDFAAQNIYNSIKTSLFLKDFDIFKNFVKIRKIIQNLFFSMFMRKSLITLSTHVPERLDSDNRWSLASLQCLFLLFAVA